MKYLLILLFPLTLFSQTSVGIWGITGNEVDFTFQTKEVEYASDLGTLLIDIQSDRGKTVRSERVDWKFERNFDFDFTLKFQQGTYRILVYSKDKELLAISKYFTIGHINDR